MINQDTVRKFIELRAQGLTFRAIAAQLDVSPSTLVGWSSEHRHHIENLKSIDWEDFTAQAVASRKERTQSFVSYVKRLESELDARDLSTIPTARILTLLDLFHRRLERQIGCVEFSDSLDLTPAGKPAEMPTEKWKA